VQSEQVSQHISTIHSILEGGAQQQHSSLIRVHDGEKHKLTVAENSVLDRTLAALCAPQNSNQPTASTGVANGTSKVPVQEIRTLLKVGFPKFPAALSSASSFSGLRCLEDVRLEILLHVFESRKAVLVALRQNATHNALHCSPWSSFEVCG
jgi:hypothetical protein